MKKNTGFIYILNLKNEIAINNNNNNNNNKSNNTNNFTKVVLGST